jgi:hypothetical protein
VRFAFMPEADRQVRGCAGMPVAACRLHAVRSIRWCRQLGRAYLAALAPLTCCLAHLWH